MIRTTPFSAPAAPLSAPLSTPLTLQLKYFASLREGLGVAAETWHSHAPTLGALRQELAARGGAYAQHLAPERTLRMALNQTLAEADTPLQTNAEIAFFPPVTGG